MSHDLWIGPSVLSADFLRLGEQLRELEDAGADYVHFDVMDGSFVPNISIGLPVLDAAVRGTSLPVDCHLMVVHPERWVDPFADAGAHRFTFHVEATPHAHRIVQAIEARGMMPGITLNPSTSLSSIEELIPYVGQVLIMSVNPGFGGQSYIESMTDKIRGLRDMIDRMNPQCRLQIDGGVNVKTIGTVVAAGADTIVAGSAVFAKGATLAENLGQLRAAASSATE